LLRFDETAFDDPVRIAEGAHNLRINLLFRVGAAERIGVLSFLVPVLCGGKVAKKPSQFTAAAIINFRQPIPAASKKRIKFGRFGYRRQQWS
jgi:hypothetical protein